MTSVVAAAGVFLLAACAPFEMTTPILRLPWQALTNLEAVLLAALAAWAAAIVKVRRVPRLPPLVRAAIALVAAMAIASALAPSDRLNAWHMTGRFAAAVAVVLLTIEGIATGRRLQIAMSLSVAAGVAVAVAAMLEYAQVDWALRVLQVFRPSVNVVGAQVRASGTLQYPTIASMYLEIVFAFGLGLMLHAADESRRLRAAAWMLALLATGEAVALTFTRAGLLTIGTSLTLAGAIRMRRHGLETGMALLVVLAAGIAALLIVSRSRQSLWLRMTSEGQGSWYRAEIRAPADLSMSTDGTQYVTVSVTNTGRATWDSTDDPPVFLSYHWLLPDEDRVVAYEGERTAFASPVGPGDIAVVHALVRAPRRPGAYRLEWDLAQEGRLWFSTEQDAPPSSVSCATVVGPPAGGPLKTTMRPGRATRPGRLVLWRAAARMIAAHPFFGSGPDNFRLRYGDFANLPGADPRTHSNNMYLEIVVGGGVIAAAAFAWLLREASRVFASLVQTADARAVGLAAAGVAIAAHGAVDSFVSFAPTYILFALTLGLAVAAAGGLETSADAYRS